MRLALLGIDETTFALARAAQESGRDELVMLCDVEGTEQAQLLFGAGAIPAHSWDTLLTGTDWRVRSYDAVLVSRDPADDERRLEQLRKLVQDGVPMLVAHPVHSSMLAYYELDMIRRETDCLMTPFLPARRHPLAVRFKDLLDQPDTSPLGRVDQILLERAVAARSKSNVLAEFARDVDLLRFLGGELPQLLAMGSPGTTGDGEFAAYTNLGVQMTGAENRSVRWWVAPVDEFRGGRLTITGDRGKATLIMPPAPSVWRLELRTGGEPAVEEASSWNAGAAALDDLRTTLADRQQPSRWPDAARAIELADTIDRSLKKGRTIDLYEQEYSSAATFKGIMSGVGCGLLLLALAGMFIGAVAANMLKHAGLIRAAQIVGTLPYIFLMMFVVFLALQLLLRVARSK